jgi:hypothetical protein
MQTPHAHLFQDIDWSTDRVAAQTRTRASALGLELLELPVWYDVDDRDGLTRLLDELRTPVADGSIPYEAPATVACIRNLGLRTPLQLFRTAGEVDGAAAEDA